MGPPYTIPPEMMQGSKDLFVAVQSKKEKKEKLDKRLAAGANPNLYEDPQTGDKVLHVAAKQGRRDIVEILMSKGPGRPGATPHLPNKAGDTPLHDAAANGHQDAVEILLTRDTDSKHTKNLKNQTPADAAKAAGKMDLHDMLSRMPKPTAQQMYDKIKKTENAEHVRMYLEAGGKLDHVDIFTKDTCMHAAAARGIPKILRMLLETEDGERPSVNSENKNGRSALHIACGYGHADAVRLLLEHGANADHRDQAQQLPYDLATTYKHPECVKILDEFKKC